MATAGRTTDCDCSRVDNGDARPSLHCSAKSLSDLAHTFEVDGYLTLSSLLTPLFTTNLRDECMAIFYGVLEWLHAKGEIDFGDSYRKTESKGCDEALEKSLGQGRETTTKASSQKYEYPLKAGLKNGYKELVMRSPGRYELALLLSDFPGDHFHRIMGAFDDDGADYDGQWLLSPNMFRWATEQAVQNPLLVETGEGNSAAKSSLSNRKDTREKSFLKKLLGWVQNGINGNSSSEINANIHNDGACSREQECFPLDEKNIRTFMKLLGAIFPTSNNNRAATHTKNSGGSDVGNGDCSSGIEDQKQSADYYLCNFSLLVATPGCPAQPWHADGGHASLSTHLPCHVLNVFVPLVDVPPAMGPTELRPGTHRHTRNLAPMMLAARARRTLRDPVAPALGRGDGLVFDYRILHRGRANASDGAPAAADLGGGGSDSRRREGDAGVGGRHRPVLVLTFARRWFVDVCNFPKNSIFSIDENQ